MSYEPVNPRRLARVYLQVPGPPERSLRWHRIANVQGGASDR